jgi:predicted nucleic acid-binding protein
VNVVVDTSAAVEFLLRTEVGLRIEGVVADANMFAPELLDAEVTAVLRRHVLRGELAGKRAAEALEDLISWDVERVSHRDLVLDAWSFRKKVSAYDAFYLAAARRHAASVLTSDGPLARVPTPTGVVVHDVSRK